MNLYSRKDQQVFVIKRKTKKTVLLLKLVPNTDESHILLREMLKLIFIDNLLLSIGSAVCYTCKKEVSAVSDLR